MTIVFPLHKTIMFSKFSLGNKFKIKQNFVLNLLSSLIIFRIKLKLKKNYIIIVKYIIQKLKHYEL